MDYSVIVTADDLGLDSNINRGIEEAFQQGIVSCAALLMNAPSTDEGILIAKSNPDLEVGIHLSIVEGYSLRGIKSSITEENEYFENRVCLKRDWKEFLKSYIRGKINLLELEEEMELQIQMFITHFKKIPFLNSTQHLHLLPAVWKIVIKLCKKYDIKAIRLPKLTLPNIFWFNIRILYLLPFFLMGSLCRLNLHNSDIKCPDNLVGLQYSGNINTSKLLFIFKNLNKKTIEIILHPGYNSDYLRRRLPDSYKYFRWEDELKAAISGKLKEYITKNKIQIIRFSDL